MKKNIREQLKSQALPEEDLSAEEQQLLQQMLDKQLENKWAAALAKQGIHRAAPRLSRSVKLRPWLAAAALAVIALAAWLLLYALPSAAKRSASAYLEQNFSLSADTRDGIVDTSTQRTQSLRAYQNKDYQSALTIITPLLAEGHAADFLLAGLSNTYLKNYQAAAFQLESAQRMRPDFYTDEINWRLGLLYILLNDNAKARTVLNKVAESNSSRNRDEARKLLEKI